MRAHRPVRKLPRPCGKDEHHGRKDPGSPQLSGLRLPLLGAAVEGSRIVVDDKMQTTVPGLYAAGDCTGGLLQVAKAVYEGALAGTEAAKALRKG